ncbi:NADPH-dependent FMN reductase [Methanospirillum hungatei JF-1]|jgi:putative NADPH-quinone reductase|uniref:NADPH-dependent FMN reductase n=1 Tax=Methanospirillum hungatei JF-1 (strain ATCC 27890 / DSM 864 / NBRC 100397 / JF-1) TaxID=323259 RepID=Q2FNC0_METHJ|nr:flavodoxin family protein [Methanospirillum hungatei]ABD42428.1 NADPH-dependent FMN reductase [Methanospirillum hungatei JF-1]
MTPIRVLAIAGSPRRHGNSEILLDWILDEMGQDPDVRVTKVVLSDADIAPCRGCNACEKLNACVNHDGMDLLHDQILEADCIILSAPIYCMSICAQAKALVDRAQVFRSRKYVLKLPVVPPERIGKRWGIFISTAGQDWDYVFDAAIPVVKCFFHVIEVKNRDLSYLMIRHVDEKGAVMSHPTARGDALSLSRSVLETMKERLT